MYGNHKHCQLPFDILFQFRSLGVEHSFVLSCRLDEWTNEQVEHMASKGNEKMNKDLEYCVPKTIEVPYEKYTDRDTREKYIRAKYVDLLFKKLENRSPSPPKRVYRKVSRTSTSSASSLREAAMVEFIGIVNVKLVEGRNLIVKDIVSSDPYCVLTVGLQTRKSTIKKSSLNPLYNEEFAFSWDGKDELKIEIFDHDDLSKDDHMGVISLDLDFLKKNKDKLFESWHQVTHRKHRNRQQGELLLELSFFPIE